MWANVEYWWNFLNARLDYSRLNVSVHILDHFYTFFKDLWGHNTSAIGNFVFLALQTSLELTIICCFASCVPDAAKIFSRETTPHLAPEDAWFCVEVSFFNLSVRSCPSCRIMRRYTFEIKLLLLTLCPGQSYILLATTASASKSESTNCFLILWMILNDNFNLPTMSSLVIPPHMEQTIALLLQPSDDSCNLFEVCIFLSLITENVCIVYIFLFSLTRILPAHPVFATVTI